MMSGYKELEICAALAKSPYFDQRWYLMQYPDVEASKMDPVLHYVRYGEKEGRSPSPHFLPSAHKAREGGYGNILYDFIMNPVSPDPAIDAINIIFAANDAYVPYMSVAIASISANASPAHLYNIYILYTNIGSEVLHLLQSQSVPNVKIIPVCVYEHVKPLMEKAYVHSRFSVETYFRIIIPKLFPKMERCIYLDCDIIVNSNLLDLYKIELGKNLIAAVEETYLEPEYLKKRMASLPIKVNKYFNAGVLLIDISEFIREDIYDKFMDHVISGVKFRAQDQDILNIICNSRVKYLHVKWNLMWQFYIKEAYRYAPRSMLQQFIEAFYGPKIIHFNSDIKPWSKDDGHFSKFFWQYAALSPFRDRLKSGR